MPICEDKEIFHTLISTKKREVYLDYAASTPLCQESVDAMCYAMKISTGNPSSSHFAGRKSRVLIEQARRNIADLLHCPPQHLIFTSSGAESIDLGISSICKTYHPNAIMTSVSEHASVLRTIENAAESFSIPVIYVNKRISDDSFLLELNQQLEKHPSSLLCLAHGNHVSGEMLPVKEVGKLCKKYHSLFFCNMAQTIGKYDIHLEELPIDFAAASAHKFGAAKGVGFLYYKQNINPLFQIENQGYNFFSESENIYGICSMEAALQANLKDLKRIQDAISSIKSYCIKELEENFPTVQLAENNKKTGLYHLFSFHFPEMNMENMFMRLDIAGIAVSLHFDKQSNQPLLRLSFRRKTTKEEIDYFINTLSEILSP